MNTKCASCGEIKATPFRFVYDYVMLGYTLFFCYDCGKKIHGLIPEEK